GGVAGIHDPHLLHHLAHDHLDVLVVDRHTLETVNLLHLVDEVLLYRVGAEDAQDVLRGNLAVRQRLAGPHEVVLVYEKVLRKRHEVDLRGLAVAARYDHFLRTALTAAERDDTVDLTDDCRVGGRTSFEKLGHTRQTTRDVTGLRRLARDLGDDLTGLHLIALVNRNTRANRKRVLTHAAVRVNEQGRRQVTL